MRYKSGSIDKVLRLGMTAAGICLLLMISGKAVGMMHQEPEMSYRDGDGKKKAAGYLLNVWDFYYPVGKASEAAGSYGGWTGSLWARDPVSRFFAMQESKEEGNQAADPSYENYQKTREFYQEHQYLAYYGDEESNQEYAAPDVVLPADTKEPDEVLESETVQTTQTVLPMTGTKYVMEQLADYDFLMKHFYIVHTSTTATREEMDAHTLLNMDLSIEKDSSKPQILIYHTHSQETYADYGPENPDATVVGIGSYLTELLQAKGYHVIHHKEIYDFRNGELDRSKAYTYALDGISGILQQNPSIEVVLDVHRDGVKEGLHLVSEVNGKQTAPIMFFNGMSQTPTEAIEYLNNPYKEENLAFSLQMQLDAAAYYPGLTRKIYLKGLRYNLHMRPRSALIEVGAQTNTYEEARNTMEPLAELLDMVLQGD